MICYARNQRFDVSLAGSLVPPARYNMAKKQHLQMPMLFFFALANRKRDVLHPRRQRVRRDLHRIVDIHKLHIHTELLRDGFAQGLYAIALSRVMTCTHIGNARFHRLMIDLL